MWYIRLQPNLNVYMQFSSYFCCICQINVITMLCFSHDDGNSDNIASAEYIQHDVRLNESLQKRRKNSKTWKQNIWTRERQSGGKYISIRGKDTKKIKISGSCKQTCRFKCANIISNAKIQKMHNDFWKLKEDKKKFTFKIILFSNNPKVKKETGKDRWSFHTTLILK